MKTKRKPKTDFLRLTAGDYVFHILNYVFFVSFAVICIFPFYYIFINTISENDLVRAGMIRLFPRGIHFTNYANILKSKEIGQATLVTLSRTFIGTLTMVLASAFVGYLVTKQNMWGRKLIYRLIVISMYFNAGLIPTFMNMTMLGLTNNYLVYIIPSLVAPFNIMLVKTYIESIPTELEESASIDGAGYFKIFCRLILPLSKPILATIAIFGAVGHWNSFFDSMIYMSSRSDLHTLQYNLYKYLNQTSNLANIVRGGGMVDANAIRDVLNNRVIKLTVSMVTILPILLVYPFMQRYFEKGIMIGAVKG